MTKSNGLTHSHPEESQQPRLCLSDLEEILQNSATYQKKLAVRVGTETMEVAEVYFEGDTLILETAN